MATVNLCGYVAPLLGEDEVYPTRHRSIPIKETFNHAALALSIYEELLKDSDDNAERLLNCIKTASQLILDASGYLFKNEITYDSWFDKEIKIDHRFDFISVYRTIFPEVNVEELKQIPIIAPIFAEKTRELARRLSNPERLAKEERNDLADKLIEVSKSINQQQYRANR